MPLRHIELIATSVVAWLACLVILANSLKALHRTVGPRLADEAVAVSAT